jgi:hypothetical protein
MSIDTICFSNLQIVTDMDLSKRFQEAASNQAIRIISLEMDRKYPTVLPERILTKFFPTVLLRIKEKPYNIVKCVLPKRYSSVITDEDIESINTQRASLTLIYKGQCEKSKLYILCIEE